jgi:Methyltransferase domain
MERVRLKADTRYGTFMHMRFSPSSRGRLTDRDLDRFPEDTLFHRLARAVCHAGCLPRKELYEAWEVGRRVRRLFRGGRIVDLGAGHGLLAHVMLLLDDSSPGALVVDTALALSSARVHEALVHAWPRLSGRVQFLEQAIDDVQIERGDIVASSHACGALTDRILDRASAAGARVAVLPCCHDLAACDTGELAGWVDGPIAIDIVRALGLKQRGYRIWTQTIPSAITPKNRLLLGAPRQAASRTSDDASWPDDQKRAAPKRGEG